MSNHNHHHHHHHHTNTSHNTVQMPNAAATSAQPPPAPPAPLLLPKAINATSFVGVLTNGTASTQLLPNSSSAYSITSTTTAAAANSTNKQSAEQFINNSSYQPLVAGLSQPAVASNSNNTTNNTTNVNTSSMSKNSAVIPTKLYVTNFPFTCNQRQIQDLFSRYGQVVECTLKKDYYAYIQYTNTRGAQAAFKNANGVRMMGRKLTVHLATSKKSQSHLNHPNTPTGLMTAGGEASSPPPALAASPPPSSSASLSTNAAAAAAATAAVLNSINNTKIIHVRNFPENCSQQHIRDGFQAYGEIVECLILHDSYAFVHFKSAQDARLALQSTNNSSFMQHTLLVQYSRSKFKQQNPAAPASADAAFPGMDAYAQPTMRHVLQPNESIGPNDLSNNKLNFAGNSGIGQMSNARNTRPQTLAGTFAAPNGNTTSKNYCKAITGTRPVKPFQAGTTNSLKQASFTTAKGAVKINKTARSGKIN